MRAPNIVLPKDWRAIRTKNGSLGPLIEQLAIANLPDANPNLAGSRIQRIVDGDEQIIARTLKVLNPDTGEGVTVIQIIENDVKVVNDLYVGDNIGILQSQGLQYIQAFGFMHVWGAWEGVGSTPMFEWIGPDIAPNFSACGTTNAYYYRAVIDGSLVEGGSGDLGINKLDEDDALTTGHSVVIIHSDDGTMGGNALGGADGIAVTVYYAWIANLITNSAPPAAGTISAELSLERTKGGGAATEVDTFTANGTRTVEPLPGGYWAISEYMVMSDQYDDPDIDTDPRTYELTLTSRTGTVLTPDGSLITGGQTLRVASNEEP